MQLVRKPLEGTKKLRKSQSKLLTALSVVFDHLV
jgi:hypothetical protein